MYQGYKNETPSRTMSQVERYEHWTKFQALYYFSLIHQGQPSHNFCTNLTFLSKEEQPVRTIDLCQLHSGFNLRIGY